jgi:hypothetical protein
MPPPVEAEAPLKSTVPLSVEKARSPASLHAVLDGDSPSGTGVLLGRLDARARPRCYAVGAAPARLASQGASARADHRGHRRARTSPVGSPRAAGGLRHAPCPARGARSGGCGPRTKASAARTRVIAVPPVTAQELRAWQLESGGRGDDPIVGPMTANALCLLGRQSAYERSAAATTRDLPPAPFARLGAPLRGLHGHRGRRAARPRAGAPPSDLRPRDPGAERQAVRRPRRADHRRAG